jgi:Bacterial Ig-like domain (group 3)/FG-GAP-like repeat
MWNLRDFSACRRNQPSCRLSARLLLLVLPVVALVLPMAQAAAAPTVTTLTISSPSVAWHTAVTLTASVTTGGSRVTAGSIVFCDATNTLSTAPLSPAAIYCGHQSVIGTAQLTSVGTAILNNTPAIGIHNYTAVFTATATAAASSSTAQTLTVTGLYPTTTAIAASGNPSGYGLTATVVGLAGNPPLMTGTVSFQDTTNGNFVLGTASLGAPTFAQSFIAAPGSPVAAGNSPAVAGVGDFNGDGIPDLAVVNSGDTTVTVLLGKGDGTFTPATTIPAFGTPPCASLIQSNCAIAVGDFDDDGNADLAVTSGNDNTVTLLKGNGHGAFLQFTGSPISVGNFPEAVKIGDFNNDGVQDLAVANANDDTVSILLGNGDGTFTEAAGSPVSVGVGSFPFFMAVADFNQDGSADLAVVNGRDNSVSFLEGDGHGGFTPFSGSPFIFANGAGSCPIVAADFNGDGLVDLAVANYNDNDVAILVGDGHGSFTEPNPPIPVGVPNQYLNPFAMIALDYNDDGITDLAVVNYSQYNPSGSLTLLRGDGTGNFAPAGPDIALGSLPNDVVTADFNGDGKPDLAIPESGETDTTILLDYFTQTATASVANITIAGTGTHFVDANYSGNAYFAPSTSAKIPLQGSAVSTTLTLSASPTQQLVTMPVTFTTQLTSTSPYPPTGAPTGAVSFFDAGALIGTAPINAAGQAVFTTSSLADGVHPITASYAGDPNYLPSTSAAVSITISDLQITRIGNNNTTVLPGTTVTYNLKVAPLVATTFLYSVGLTATGLPAGAIATFSPATLPAGGGTTTVTLTIQTAKAAALNAPPPMPPYKNLPLALGLLVPLLGAVPLRRRIRKIPGTLALLLLAGLSLPLVAGLSGCSGAGLFAARKIPYAITVTATSGTLQRSTSVPLAIQ